MSHLPLYPLSFEPFLRPMPWGGHRLAPWTGRAIAPDVTIGEAWLMSDHRLHASRVAAGPLQGWTLRQLMEQRGDELLGYRDRRFPLLIKLLDANENLSVQVHPDDADAQRWAPGEGGKTEAWVVLETQPHAVIYLGLKPGIHKAMLECALARGTAPSCLERYDPQPGQCYFVPAGAIHALGGGVLVLEIQQTSDATFRLYDWGRLDAHGKPRPLQLEAGLACLKERPAAAGLRRPQALSEGSQQLVANDCFELRRQTLNGPTALHGPCIAIGLEGQGVVRHPVYDTPFHRGGTVFIPVGAPGCVLEPDGTCTVAVVQVPPRRHLSRQSS